jgi:hypothetical protein
VRPGNEFATALVNALDAKEVSWRSYSGRGMCGDCCVSVACGSNRDHSEEDVLEAVKGVPGGLRVTRDQLGMGMVLYWPQAVMVD